VLSASRGTTSIDEGKLTQLKKRSEPATQPSRSRTISTGRFFLSSEDFSAEEAADHREQLENLEAKYGLMHYRTKPYLLMKSAIDIAQNPVLMDAVESLLGPENTICADSLINS
ncbi:MAG: hypothetical protein OSA97_17510, partial [Nevskia sp.]|nr:hypothetical protein [Nevskia sp.]